jgi:hypothetical protein
MVLVIFSELLASICVSFVVSALFAGDMAVSTTLATGTSITRGLCMFYLCNTREALLIHP